MSEPNSDRLTAQNSIAIQLLHMCVIEMQCFVCVFQMRPQPMYVFSSKLCFIAFCMVHTAYKCFVFGCMISYVSHDCVMFPSFLY